LIVFLWLFDFLKLASSSSMFPKHYCSLVIFNYFFY